MLGVLSFLGKKYDIFFVTDYDKSDRLCKIPLYFPKKFFNQKLSLLTQERYSYPDFQSRIIRKIMLRFIGVVFATICVRVDFILGL